MRYVYTGNAHDVEADTTYCHGCGQELIVRDWFRLLRWNLTPEGTCPQCCLPCAGVFEAAPGRWGPRRQVVDPAQWAAQG